jgi:hypothetical protein
MSKLGELLDAYHDAVYAYGLAYETRTDLAYEEKQVATARAALVAYYPRWIPLSEQRPPEDVTRYTARVVNGVSYWAALPEFPQPPVVRIVE